MTFNTAPSPSVVLVGLMLLTLDQPVRHDEARRLGIEWPHNMKTDQSLAAQPYRSVLKLNVAAWALLVVGGVSVFLLFDRPAGIEPPLLLLMPVVAGLGAATNLLLALLSLWRGEQKIASLYLLGFLLLAICLRGQYWWVETYLD